MGRALASCLVGRCCAWFESRPVRAKNEKIKLLELAPFWLSANNDCSRETLQRGCDLRRSPVVLPTAFPSEQLRRRPSACGRERGDLFNTFKQISVPGDRRRHSKDNFCVVQLHCNLVLAIAVCKNFPQIVLVSSPFWSTRRTLLARNEQKSYVETLCVVILHIYQCVYKLTA